MFLDKSEKQAFLEVLIQKLSIFEKNVYLVMDTLSETKIGLEMPTVDQLEVVDCSSFLILTINVQYVKVKSNMHLYMVKVGDGLIINCVSEVRQLQNYQIQQIKSKREICGEIAGSFTLPLNTYIDFDKILVTCISILDIKNHKVVQGNLDYIKQNVSRYVLHYCGNNVCKVFSTIEHIGESYYVLRMYIGSANLEVVFDAGCVIFEIY